MEGKQRASIKRGESVNAYNNSLANCRWVEDSRGLCATMDRGIHYRRCNLPVVKTDIYMWGGGVASIHPQIEIFADENCHAEASHHRSALLKLFACLETQPPPEPEIAVD